MKKIMKSVCKKMSIIKWAYQLAWRIDKKMLLVWNLLSVFISVLPALSLIYQEKIISALSVYVDIQKGTFNEVLIWILGYGLTLILIGLSTRVNKDLIYMMMYDSYYLGMQEFMMDSLQEVEMIELLKSELNDDYNYIVDRAGSLTDIMSGACELIGKSVSICSLLYVASGVSKIVFIFSSVYIVAMFILNFKFTEKVRWNATEFAKVSRVANYYEELPNNPGSAKEIRIFENQEFIIQRWKEANKEVQNYEKNRYFQMELATFLTSIGFLFFLSIVIFSQIISVKDGELEVSIFLMLFNLCLNLYAAINGVARAVLAFDYGLYALGRQKDFMQKIPLQEKNNEETYQTRDEEVVFRVRNVSFEYQKGKKVLDNLNFEIKKGEIIALVGVNGSGKTTLTKLLLGMYKPSRGSMELCGVSYERYSRQKIREKIGVFFQEFFLFHAPIFENVAYGSIDNIEDIERINTAIRNGGAVGIIKRLKNGINTILGKTVFSEGVELSGGEKQRIAVARAHMNAKDILIFDEPASALDPLAEAEQFLNLREKMRGKTVVLVSHRVGFARMADRIFMMQDGKLVEVGTHEELMKLKGIYSDFYSKQAEWYETEMINDERK